jgi:hypothetical protein
MNAVKGLPDGKTIAPSPPKRSFVEKKEWSPTPKPVLSVKTLSIIGTPDVIDKEINMWNAQLKGQFMQTHSVIHNGDVWTIAHIFYDAKGLSFPEVKR